MFENLLVGGCSFTQKSTWAVVLQRQFNPKKYYDCALGGAGNYHISQSVQWALENSDFNPEKTLVIVMWSGNDRDDEIIDAKYLNRTYSSKFLFTPDVATAITGGMHENAISNTQKYVKNFYSLKSKKSKAIENYLHISFLYHYLKSNNYKFIFLDYLNRSLPNRTVDFDIINFLPKKLKAKYLNMVPRDIEDIYSYCLKNNMLDTSDDFHQTAEGQLDWALKILLPYIGKKLCIPIKPDYYAIDLDQNDYIPIDEN